VGQCSWVYSHSQVVSYFLTLFLRSLCQKGLISRTLVGMKWVVQWSVDNGLSLFWHCRFTTNWAQTGILVWKAISGLVGTSLTCYYFLICRQATEERSSQCMLTAMPKIVTTFLWIVLATVSVLDLAGFIGLRCNGPAPSKIAHFLCAPLHYG
jgi:hypothetical protein